MSAFFVSASTQRLFNSATPITGYPFTAGMWAFPNVLGVSKPIFDISDGAATNFFRLSTVGTNAFQISANPGNSSNAGTVVANQWFYILGRFISAANRRISVLSSDGIISNAQNVINVTPTGLINVALGASAPTATPAAGNVFDGNVAEFFITNSDIQPDGLQLQDAMLRQLARGGPFSLPHIAKDIADYRSLRSSLGSDTDAQPDYDLGNRGRQIWANVNGVIRAAHPPQAMGYMGPASQIQNRVV